MYKKTYSKFMLLIAMMLLGAGSTWAAEETLTIGFEDASYTDWTLTTIKPQQTNSGVSAHGGSYFATTDGKTTGSVVTKAKIASPKSITFFVSKLSTNTTASSWYVKVSTDGETWQEVGNAQSASADITKGTWTEVTRSLSSYSNVYIGVFYDGTTAQRCIDDITITYESEGSTNPVDPTITISSETVSVGKTVTISGPSNLAMSFKSSNPAVASVDESGVVTGVAEGEATITASWEAVANVYNAGSKEFIINVTPAIASTVYEKVTATNQLVAGNEYILVAESSNVAMGAVNTSSSKIRDYVKVTIANEKVEITDEAVAVLTLGGSAGAWTFLASDNNKYLALTGNSNEVHASDDATLATSKWTVTNDFQLETTAQSDTRYLRYNSGSPRFACYKSGQVSAFLYVKSGSETSTKVDADLSYSETSFEVNLGEAFTAPTLSNPNQLEVAYASSNTDVATVDETSGAVTIVAAGETTITASFAGNDEFNAGSASYTLTVVDPNAPGTENNPYTVDQAIAYINTLGTASSPSEVYVKGVISQVDSYNSRYSSITYWISDDGTTDNQMEVYSGLGLNGATFESVDDLQVGDEVTVKGTVKMYNEIPEFNYNSIITSFNRPVAAEVKYYLAGSFATTDQWIDDMVELTNNDGIYTTTKTFDADTKFKIVKEDIDGTTTWYGGEGNETYRIHRDWCTDITLVDGQDFIINEAGEYTFSVNTTGTALTLTVTGFPAQEFFLAGSFNEWSTTDTKFEAGETEGVYTLTQELEAGAEFKVVSEGKYYSTNETLADNTTLQITEGTNNMTVAQAGTYTFTLAKTPNGLFLTVTFPQPVVTYYLAGSFATTEEWIDDMKELTANEDGTFSVTQEFAANTEFKIVKTVDGAESWFGGNTEDTGDEFYFIHKNWCTGIPLSADADKDGGYKNFKIESAGEYTFTLNVTDNGLFFDVTGWPISTEGNMFVKVASNDEFEDGAYLIVYEPESVAFNGGLETLDATNNSISVVINNGAIEATDATKAALFIFENGTIKSASGHYIGVTSNSNGLKQNDDATTYTNAVSFDENGNAIIAAVFDGSTMTIRYNDNSDQKRFRYLKNNGENPVQLYKLVEDFVPTVTIGEAQWATYVAVDNVVFPEGVTAYVPVEVNEGHTAVMIQSVSAVQKGEPVILNGEAGTYELSIAETEPAEVNNLFEVSDGTAVSGGTFYMLSYKNETVGFRKVQSGVTIPAGKPYIVIDNAAKEFIPFGGSEATGIESFETIGFDVNAPIYDMQGRQVQKLQKGIFIQNGKKLIVK